MTGYTAQQIRDAVKAVLAADADVTAVIAADRMEIGQIVPVQLRTGGNTLTVDVLDERETKVGIGTQTYQTRVETDIFVDAYVKSTSEAGLVTAMDVIDTIKTSLLEGIATWLVPIPGTLERMQTRRVATDEGQQPGGRAGLQLTISHYRDY